jgi:hypothetical protein
LVSAPTFVQKAFATFHLIASLEMNCRVGLSLAPHHAIVDYGNFGAHASGFMGNTVVLFDKRRKPWHW